MNDDTRKKVVFILPLLCSGGAERALITLMNNLDTEKFISEMVVLDDYGPLKDWIKEGIPLHNLGGVRVSRAFFKLKRKLKELKPDVVITTMAHSNFLLLLMKPFFPNVKFIVREAVIPSSILKEHKNKAFILKLLYKILYRKADHVISPSQDIIGEFSALGINTYHHSVLFNQVDEKAIQSTLQDISFPKNEEGILKFVCAGRLHHQKGYDRLINALRTFSPSHDWVLYILGDGAEKQALQNLITTNNLEDKIFLHGNVKKPWPIIAAADCLLLPSRWEGMPNVVLESLACGTAVIASVEANGVEEIRVQCLHNTVQTAKDINDMINAMALLEPQNKQAAAYSCLPQAFKTEVVMKQFENILMY